MLRRVENSFNYSSVDLDMASKSFNVCDITLMYSMKALSALFYQGCKKKATPKFRMDMEQEEEPLRVFPL